MNEQDQTDTQKYGLNGTVEGQRQFSQAPSPFAETRSMLKKLAMAHGAETAIGRACHNLLEQTENYAKTTDFDQRVQLKANINREMARLDDISNRKAGE
jgi:hypothetical protein